MTQKGKTLDHRRNGYKLRKNAVDLKKTRIQKHKGRKHTEEH